MTAPNWLSIGRVILVPVCVALLLYEDGRYEVAAAVVFAVAAATDWVDGRLARARGSITTLGTFLDPLADKLLVTCTLIALVQLQRVSAWVAMVIVAREFAVTGLRMVAASAEVIAASGLGKWKAFAQMVAILALMLELQPDLLTDVLVAVAVVLTILSAVLYFRASWHHLRTGAAR